MFSGSADMYIREWLYLSGTEQEQEAIGTHKSVTKCPETFMQLVTNACASSQGA